MLKLTLTEAINSDRLAEFIAQEQARGVGPVNRAEVDAAIKHLATTPLKSGTGPFRAKRDHPQIQKGPAGMERGQHLISGFLW